MMGFFYKFFTLANINTKKYINKKCRAWWMSGKLTMYVKPLIYSDNCLLPFFQPFAPNFLIYLMCVSYKQHVVRFIFFSSLVGNLYLLIRVFSLLH